MGTARRSAITAALAAIATIAAAAPAHAVDRYVSPTGTATTPCIQADPCSLTAAAAEALDGDTIIVSLGAYTLTSELVIADGVAITGVYGAPRPAITGHGLKLGPRASARYLGIAPGAGTHAIELDGASAYDMVLWADAASSGSTPAILRTHTAGTLLQDAVVVSEVPTAPALQFKDSTRSPGGSATLLATTIVGRHGADAIVAKADQGTQTMINTVTWGTDEIEVKGAASLTANNSNFRPATLAGVIDGGGNQTAKPCWVAEDDVRPLSTSPTVDAGLADVRLVNDPWGVPHAPADIGALEWQASNDALGTDCLYPSFTPDDIDPPGGGDAGGIAPPPPPNEPPIPADPPATTPVITTSVAPPVLPPAGPPILGTTVTVFGAKGTILIRLPGSDTPVKLTADSTIPVGAVIDATNGHVQLTSATNASGKTQTGEFWGTQFRVKQTKDRYTELVLTGDALDSCKSKKGTKGKKKARATRSLWGRDRNGRFRTRGRNGTATVRGTRWLTEDSCDGTLFRVTQGAIDVRDDVEKRTIRLKAGDRYLADDKPAKKKSKKKSRKS